MGMSDYLKEESGKPSASRAFLAGGFVLLCIIFALWVNVVLGLYRDAWPWERFQPALTWGSAFVGGTVLPYITNKIITGWRERRGEKDK